MQGGVLRGLCVQFLSYFLKVGVGCQGTGRVILVQRICEMPLDILRIDKYNNYVQVQCGHAIPSSQHQHVYAVLRCTFLPYCPLSFICPFPIPIPFIFQSPSFPYLPPALLHLSKTCPFVIWCSFVNDRTPVPCHLSSWEPGANEAGSTETVPAILRKTTWPAIALESWAMTSRWRN
jgi:hypothetical protein